MRRSTRSAVSVTALVAVVVLVASGCSKSSSSSDSTTSAPTTVFVQKFRYHGMPATLSAGVHTFLFENKESFPITHEMIPVAVPSGQTAQDVIDAAKSKGPSSEDEWLHIGGDFGPADTGASVVETLYLPPGTYAINGPPHAAKGMVFEFHVT
jgi:hypothetical protein